MKCIKGLSVENINCPEAYRVARAERRNSGRGTSVVYADAATVHASGFRRDGFPAREDRVRAHVLIRRVFRLTLRACGSIRCSRPSIVVRTVRSRTSATTSIAVAKWRSVSASRPAAVAASFNTTSYLHKRAVMPLDADRPGNALLHALDRLPLRHDARRPRGKGRSRASSHFHVPQVPAPRTLRARAVPRLQTSGGVYVCTQPRAPSSS